MSFKKSIFKRFLTNESLCKLIKLAKLNKSDDVAIFGDNRLEKIVNYNLTGGKLLRGKMVVSTYNALSTEKNTFLEEKCEILGWCTEWLQTFFLIIDDMMDSSEFRRGKPCWYKNENVGLSAINDSFLLESSIYYSLYKNFEYNFDIQSKIIKMFHEITYMTSYGQNMDFFLSTQVSIPLSQRFTIFKYKKLVEYKTSWYTFVLPVKLAHILLERRFDNSLQDILLEMGYYFQLQDDFLDCYGDNDVTGKNGTDILEGKCSWLIVKCLEFCNEKQLNILHECYGKFKNPESINIVKNVYDELNLGSKYNETNSKLYENLKLKIESIKYQKLSSFLMETLKNLNNRQK